MLKIRPTIHAEQRSFTRVGILPTKTEWCEFIRQIQLAIAGKPSTATFVTIDNQEAGREIWKGIIRGKVFQVVYRTDTAVIVTVLKEGWVVGGPGTETVMDANKMKLDAKQAKVLRRAEKSKLKNARIQDHGIE